jgi:molecular chaperone DnaK
VTIQGSSNLSESDIESMLEEAEKYASIDKEQKEKTELILTATNYCQTVEDKINNDELINCTEDEKKEIQSTITNLREILSNNNESSESIKKLFEQLQKLLQGKLN